MIGFYDYTLILTLLSLLSAVFGMCQAADGHFVVAAVCLAFSGLCDAFDGKVARTKKNRTDDEKSFGIQLDSLCDVIAFGVFPPLLCHAMGVRGYLGGLVLSYYCICAVIRLAYFNVLEINRQNQEDPGEKVFHGLPVTSVSVILPMVMLLRLCVDGPVFLLILMGVLFAVGTCFVLDFRMKQLNTPQLIGLIVLGAVVIITMVALASQNRDLSFWIGGVQ